VSQNKKERINLQIALDAGDSASLLSIAQATAAYADWMEAGTPWIMWEGIEAVRALRRLLPGETIIADLKIMDAGEYEAGIGFQAGADIVTVLSVAGDATIQGAVRAARNHGGKVLVDMLQERDMAKRIPEVLQMGAHYIGLHNAYDVPEADKEELAEIRSYGRLAPGRIVVAGGINLDNIAEIAQYHPHAIIVGRAVTAAKDPTIVAREIREILDDLYIDGGAP